MKISKYKQYSLNFNLRVVEYEYKSYQLVIKWSIMQRKFNFLLKKDT